jgi:hypothetical protein
VERRQTIGIRLVVRLLAGRRIPSYRGYALWRASFMAPSVAAKALVGSWLRAVSPRWKRSI